MLSFGEGQNVGNGEITEGIKLGRKHKANQAKAPAETYQAKGQLRGLTFSYLADDNSLLLVLVPVDPRDLFFINRGQDETGQFKADRLRKRATRHSNF